VESSCFLFSFNGKQTDSVCPYVCTSYDTKSFRIIFIENSAFKKKIPVQRKTKEKSVNRNGYTTEYGVARIHETIPPELVVKCKGERRGF
jgi:hypothetical protein